MSLFSLSLLSLSLVSLSASADTVHLKNGDKISGDILALDASSLRIKPGYTSAITIERSAIQSFETTEKRQWSINRSVQEVTIEASTDIGMVLVDNEPVPLHELLFPVADDSEPWRYSGSIEAALDGTHNSRDTQKLRAKTDLTAETLNWRHNLKTEVHYELEDDVTKRNTLQGQYSLDYLVNDYWFVRQEDFYQQDHLGINTRSYYFALGPGYRLWGVDRDKLDLVLTYNRFWLDNDFFSYQLNAWAATLNYKQYWFDGVLETFADYQVAFIDVPTIDYLSDATFGLKYLLTQHIYLSFKYDINESKSSVSHNRDISYGLGLGVNF
ncbi:DUF481 domain-containing protein [Shewanella jiangmenensis]|uniref:DUF481 domain-containing protein n=1 Tax=Shewanella jiangmenensis TaxID=2837387 RepID=UPI002032C1E6|nr:DUF481 domain-containing protein [Shewanella jiangmenensis]